jgi:DNA mismatch repair protein MutS
MAEKKGAQNETPAMRQHTTFKRQYPDYLLLFRMGDFYELFGEDARIASRDLGIALTSRSKGDSAVPLAGIPYHALDNYLGRLIRAGHRVAICEQVEDPKQAKGVVKRDVVRLVTPGTLTDQTLLEQREGNYLAAVFTDEDAGSEAEAGLAWVELSSGLFHAMSIPGDKVVDELLRIGPAEVIFPDMEPRRPAWSETVRQISAAAMTPRPPWAFEAQGAAQMLHEQFGVVTLEGFGFEESEPALSAAGAVIEYLRETQKYSLVHIRALRKFQREQYMIIDANTLRCLEIHRTLRSGKREGSLLACLDRTCTGLGSRLLERWLTYPLVGYSGIMARHKAVGYFVEDRDRLSQVRSALGECAQIDRIAANIALARVRPRELVALGRTLRILPDIADRMGPCEAIGLLEELRPNFNGMDESAGLIEAAIDPECPNALSDGGVIAEKFDEELDRLRGIGSRGRSWLAEYQQQESESTSIPIKVGFNKVFGYYIEVSNTHRDKVPDRYVRKQTLKNAERYITDELKQYETEVLSADERARELEQELFERVRVALLDDLERFLAAAESMAALDVICSLAHVAIENGYVRPEITQEDTLEIVGGRHPVLAQQLREKFVPNDVKMGLRNDRLLIVTGPNMAGKSTYIRQVALLTLMAQAGSYIPAETAVIGLADRVFTRVGAADELARGLSTFMLEMVETANILNNATSRSLVILDEVGRGTSTCDGLALAWAVCEHIALKINCRTLFATHYHELTELEQLLDGTSNLNVTVREWNGEVVFLHRIARGGTDQSYGVHVAKLAGVPGEVTRRAAEILPRLQQHLAGGLDMPDLAERARKAAAQMELFADPASRAAGEIRHADLDNLTPIQALEMLRRLQDELQ